MISFLLIFKACMNILFVVKVKIFVVIKWSYMSLIMLVIESKLLHNSNMQCNFF